MLTTKKRLLSIGAQMVERQLCRKQLKDACVDSFLWFESRHIHVSEKFCDHKGVIMAATQQNDYLVISRNVNSIEFDRDTTLQNQATEI